MTTRCASAKAVIRIEVQENIHTPSMEVIKNNIYGGEVSDKDQTSRVGHVNRCGSS